MIVFAAVAICLLLLAIAIVLWPLLRRSGVPESGRALSNLDIHRDQFAELAQDLQSGTLTAENYEQAKVELERRVLEEAAPATLRRPAASGRIAPVSVAIFIPLAAVVLYLSLGNLQGVSAPRHPAADLSSITANDFQDMTAKLAARMQQNPADAQGWKMLGRAYRAMERFAEANEAYEKAVELNPNDADLLADYAESLALGAGRSLAGEPTRLLERARKLDPNSSKVLTLSGSAAFERKDYKAAIAHWQTVLKQPGVSGELAQALQQGVDEAKARLGGKAPRAAAAPGKERVSGEVSLDASLRDKVRPDDAVFVFARAAEGPRMPLAIVKVRVADLPYRFSFDDASAMTPEMRLSSFTDIVIAARVSRSGSAVPAPGDLEGRSGRIKPGQTGVRIIIDRPAAEP